MMKYNKKGNYKKKKKSDLKEDGLLIEIDSKGKRTVLNPKKDNEVNFINNTHVDFDDVPF